MKTKTKRKKEKGYPAYYLAVVLAFVLLLEGFLIGAATPQAWQESLGVLDISAATSEAASDFAWAIEPMVDQYKSVNEFYQLAATEAIRIFDMSDEDILAFPRGVLEFYDLASIEMAEILDFSDSFMYQPQVAGTSVYR